MKVYAVLQCQYLPYDDHITMLCKTKEKAEEVVKTLTDAVGYSGYCKVLEMGVVE